jgi:glutathione S-transferase
MPLKDKYLHLGKYVEALEKPEGYQSEAAKIQDVDGKYEVSL